MPIVVYIAETYSELCLTFKMNLLAKTINDYIGEFMILSDI